MPDKSSTIFSLQWKPLVCVSPVCAHTHTHTHTHARTHSLTHTVHTRTHARTHTVHTHTHTHTHTHALTLTQYTRSIVLQQYCQLKEQMESKQFYSALKTLEQLEHTSLPQVKGYLLGSLKTIQYSLTLCLRYTFSELLSREIPKLRRSIQDQSNAELTVSVACVL